MRAAFLVEFCTQPTHPGRDFGEAQSARRILEPDEENLMTRDINKRWLRVLGFAALLAASVVLRPGSSRGSDLGVLVGSIDNHTDNSGAPITVGIRF
jgi:hypothetical protein